MFKKSIFTIIVFCFLFVAGTALGQEVKTTKPGGYLAALSEESLDKAIEYSIAQDYVALQKIIDSELVFILNGGVEVYITERQYFGGKIKIRPVGSTVEVWTIIEAVSK